jgi:hypothetical protein
VPGNLAAVQARIDLAPGMGKNVIPARQQQFDKVPAVLTSAASDQCALFHVNLGDHPECLK